MSRTGFILGKFMPLHRGHMHLIETAQSRVTRLTVLVCSLARDPIPGALRYQWVRELYPAVNVQHFTEDAPQYPHEHPDFWAIWRAIVLRYCPAPDVVFTSETYGDKLAAVVGAQHACVDIARTVFPVSGTAVRANPRAYWQFIPPPVQAYFAPTLAA